MSLKGKVAVITGSNRGLGLEIAKTFVEAKISLIILIAREHETLNKATEKLKLDYDLEPHQNIVYFPLDISDASRVQTFVLFVKKYSDKIDILINNASVFGPIGLFEDVDFLEWEHTTLVNFIGTARLTKALLPLIKKSSNGKIINIAGGGATKPYNCLSGYASSKAALVRFTEEIAMELIRYNIDVNSIAPGPLNTRFIDNMINAGEHILGNELMEKMKFIKKNGGTPFDKASTLCLFLTTEASKGISGKLISARYDSWKDFPLIKNQLMNTDIFTMRRIDNSHISK